MGLFPHIEEQHPNIAFLYALIGNISLALMQIFFKTLSKDISPLFLLFLRAFLLIFINTLILRNTNKNPDLSRKKSTPSSP